MGEKLTTKWETSYFGYTGADMPFPSADMIVCEVEWDETQLHAELPVDSRIYYTEYENKSRTTFDKRLEQIDHRVGVVRFPELQSRHTLLLLVRPILASSQLQDFVYVPDRGFIRVIRRQVELVNERKSWPYIFPDQPLKEQIIRVCSKCGTVDEDPTPVPSVTTCFASPGNCEWLDLCRKHPHGLYDSIL